MFLCIFIQRGMDHADLRRIAVRDDQLAAVFDQIRKNLHRRMHSFILAGEIGSQGLVSEGDNNAFFTHNGISLCVHCFSHSIIPKLVTYGNVPELTMLPHDWYD